MVHEGAFALLLLVTGLRLAWASGVSFWHPLLYAMAAGANALMLMLAWRRQGGTMPWWRFAFYPALMLMLFWHLRWVAAAIAPLPDAAPLLQAWDAWLFGAQPAVWLARWPSPWLTEGLAFCYIAFLPYVFWLQARMALAPPATAAPFFSGLYCIYAIGLCGYTLLPAPGPWLSLAGQFPAALEGFWIWRLLQFLYPVASNLVDAFPSLHVAVSVYCLYHDFRFNRRRFRWLLVPCAGVWISTVWLRTHYGVDVLAGFMVGGVGIMVLRGAARRWES
jgi:hypothetical protein